nr:formin-like protein 20 [Aegilops tauschii subsp. strangulata]
MDVRARPRHHLMLAVACCGCLPLVPFVLLLLPNPYGCSALLRPLAMAVVLSSVVCVRSCPINPSPPPLLVLLGILPDPHRPTPRPDLATTALPLPDCHCSSWTPQAKLSSSPEPLDPKLLRLATSRLAADDHIQNPIPGRVLDVRAVTRSSPIDPRSRPYGTSSASCSFAAPRPAPGRPCELPVPPRPCSTTWIRQVQAASPELRSAVLASSVLRSSESRRQQAPAVSAWVPAAPPLAMRPSSPVVARLDLTSTSSRRCLSTPHSSRSSFSPCQRLPPRPRGHSRGALLQQGGAATTEFNCRGRCVPCFEGQVGIERARPARVDLRIRPRRRQALPPSPRQVPMPAPPASRCPLPSPTAAVAPCILCFGSCPINPSPPPLLVLLGILPDPHRPTPRPDLATTALPLPDGRCSSWTPQAKLSSSPEPLDPELLRLATSRLADDDHIQNPIPGRVLDVRDVTRSSPMDPRSRPYGTSSASCSFAAPRPAPGRPCELPVPPRPCSTTWIRQVQAASPELRSAVLASSVLRSSESPRRQAPAVSARGPRCSSSGHAPELARRRAPRPHLHLVASVSQHAALLPQQLLPMPAPTSSSLWTQPRSSSPRARASQTLLAAPLLLFARPSFLSFSHSAHISLSPCSCCSKEAPPPPSSPAAAAASPASRGRSGSSAPAPPALTSASGHAAGKPCLRRLAKFRCRRLLPRAALCQVRPRPSPPASFASSRPRPARVDPVQRPPRPSLQPACMRPFGPPPSTGPQPMVSSAQRPLLCTSGPAS